VNAVSQVLRGQQSKLFSAGRRTANVTSGNGAPGADDNRTTGQPPEVGGVSDQDAGDVREALHDSVRQRTYGSIS